MRKLNKLMRVRHVSSLLLLQIFLPPISGGKGPQGLLQRRHSAMRFQKQSGDSGQIFFPISNLHPRGFTVSSIFPETSAFASSHFQGMVLVSVPEPGLSPDILYRCSCVRRGGETFLRPKGPSAVQPLSHAT